MNTTVGKRIYSNTNTNTKGIYSNTNSKRNLTFHDLKIYLRILPIEKNFFFIKTYFNYPRMQKNKNWAEKNFDPQFEFSVGPSAPGGLLKLCAHFTRKADVKIERSIRL